MRDRYEARWRTVVDLARRGVNAPLTSSVGRLFDAVAAIAGVGDIITYEGQAAIAPEQHDRDVPPNDGGISLGHAAVAAARPQ